MEAPARVVLDTNIVLDMFVFDDTAASALLQSLRQGALQWIGTPAMRMELERVLAYPHIARRLQQRQLTALDVLQQFDALVTVLPVAAKAAYTCKDRDDQPFIDLALAYQAALLSKDHAVLCMARRLGTRGVVVADSWAALSQTP